MDENKTEKQITLDGNPVTQQQLQEAQNNKAVRIIEDKEKPGNYKTLKKMNG